MSNLGNKRVHCFSFISCLMFFFPVIISNKTLEILTIVVIVVLLPLQKKTQNKLMRNRT